MAKDQKKKQSKRATLTVRERSEQAAPQKKRILRKTANTAAAPVRFGKKILSKIFRPFRFVLRPFKTRPVRFIGRLLATILFLRYFKNAWKEVRQVTWPNRRETWQLTMAVFIFAIVFGIIITAVDFGLEKLMRQIILK